MKKHRIAFLTLFLFIMGCAKSPAPTARMTIVTSFYPVYIIAKNIARDIEDVAVINMTPSISGCLHEYSISARDMKTIETADIFIFNGAGMETFMDKITEKYPSLKTVELASGIPLIKDHHGVNGHVWVSPSNALVMAANCAEAMARHDPVNASRYRENAGNYSVRLTRLLQEMHEKLRAYRGAKIVTFHEAFPYFAREFGLEIAAVIESEPGSEPSARELAGTVAVIRKHRIRALFAEPQYPSTAAETISRETGAAVHVLDPASSGDDSYDAYIDAMRRNLNVLKKALNE